MAIQSGASAPLPLVKAKLDEFFWEWLSLPESQKIVRQAIQFSQDPEAEPPVPSPHFSGLRGGSPSGRPSPPGSPHRAGIVRDGQGSDSSDWSSSSGAVPHPLSPSQGRSPPFGPAPNLHEYRSPDSDPSTPGNQPHPEHMGVGTSMLALGTKDIPRFWWPKRSHPMDQLSSEVRSQLHDYFMEQQFVDGIKTHTQLEPIVTGIFKLSKYFTVPIFHKIKVFYDIVDMTLKTKEDLLMPSPVPITEQMIIGWANGKIQPDDQGLSFFSVVKQEHNDWIEKEDFIMFMVAILLTHPGLDFLRETQEFQDRYSDTVICRIFYVYDRKDLGRIDLKSLRRYTPSIVETWNQLAEQDDIKLLRDYFSYEHFYVIYCTFWELDSDRDFLLDKDDLLKYDGHALSRRAADRIFSEVSTKFTSAVPGKMGYEDFIRFLLCDQDRQTDRAVEYWFNMFDLDGDGVIRDYEMKYFYDEQVQRMECLNYETIPFVDIMCQLSDMISPKAEGLFKLSDFKKRRKFAGTFFAVFTSLNKFLGFEHRDPSLTKQEQADGPSSEWHRWCAEEYLRLAMEEGDDDGGMGGEGDG